MNAISSRNRDVTYIGGHVEIRRELGNEFAFVRITSRSANVIVDTSITNLSSFLSRGSSDPFRFQQSTPYRSGNSDSGVIAGQFRVAFVSSLQRNIPGLKIQLTDEAWKDLSEAQGAELRSAVTAHNEFQGRKRELLEGGIFSGHA